VGLVKLVKEVRQSGILKGFSSCVSISLLGRGSGLCMCKWVVKMVRCRRVE